MWKYFFLGLLVGWLIEWIIDWVYWRRGTGDAFGEAGSVARPDAGFPAAPLGRGAAGDPVARDHGPVGAAAVQGSRDEEPSAGQPMAGQSMAEGPMIEEPMIEEPMIESNAGETTSADTPAGRVGVEAAMGAGSAVSTSSATLSTNAPVYRQEDLEAIDGIGPRIGAMLRNNGITTFARLAATPTTELNRIVASTGMSTDGCRVETWAAQARLATNQDWAGLAQLQAELRAENAGAGAVDRT